jgi:hypothetical protein
MKAIAQYITINKGEAVLARWQNYYIGRTISFEGQDYEPLDFEAEGIETGDLESESSLQITFPAIGKVYALLLETLRNGYILEVRSFSFDPRQGNTEPLAGQLLAGSYTGQVVGATRSQTQIIIEVGSSLSPVGSQVPPRKFSTTLIGVPCRLD